MQKNELDPLPYARPCKSEMLNILWMIVNHDHDGGREIFQGYHGKINCMAIGGGRLRETGSDPCL